VLTVIGNAQRAHKADTDITDTQTITFDLNLEGLAGDVLAQRNLNAGKRNNLRKRGRALRPDIPGTGVGGNESGRVRDTEIVDFRNTGVTGDGTSRRVFANVDGRGPLSFVLVDSVDKSLSWFLDKSLSWFLSS
jgi:hypothetical protein